MGFICYTCTLLLNIATINAKGFLYMNTLNENGLLNHVEVDCSKAVHLFNNEKFPIQSV